MTVSPVTLSRAPTLGSPGLAGQEQIHSESEFARIRGFVVHYGSALALSML